MELKPCPFCGGEAYIEQVGDHRRSTIYECDSCGCRLETGEKFNHGARWNERHEVEQLRSQQAATPAVPNYIHCQEAAARYGIDYNKFCAAHNEVLSRLAPAPQPIQPSEDASGWDAKHRNTGNIYRVTGEAINATNAQDGQTMVIYERDGRRFVREAGEFMEKFAAMQKGGA